MVCGGSDRERWVRLDLRTQKRADSPAKLTSGAEPTQCLALGQIWVMFALWFARHLVLLFRDVIALQ